NCRLRSQRRIWWPGCKNASCASTCPRRSARASVPTPISRPPTSRTHVGESVRSLRNHLRRRGGQRPVDARSAADRAEEISGAGCVVQVVPKALFSVGGKVAAVAGAPGLLGSVLGNGLSALVPYV